MSLESIAKTLSNFDPKKDNINSTGNGLPAGEYEATVENASHKTFKSGWDCFGFDLTVVSGEHAGQTEMVNLSFAEQSKNGKAIPDFVLERNAKTVMTLGKLLGVDVPVDTFLLPNETDIHEKLNQILHSHVGELVHMTITERPNKKDPSNPFKQYEFSEGQTKIETADVDGDDLPFSSENDTEVNDEDLPF